MDKMLRFFEHIENTAKYLSECHLVEETQLRSKPVAKKIKLKREKPIRPNSITACINKNELMLFTVEELKAWLVVRNIKKLSGLRKEELVFKVFTHLRSMEYSDSGSNSDDVWTDVVISN